MGRPTKYSQEIVDKAQHYLDNYEEYEEVIPSAVGLALARNIRRSTLPDHITELDQETLCSGHDRSFPETKNLA